MTDLDHRVQCVSCAHYVAGKCHNAIAARLWPTGKVVREVGLAMSVLKQHCPGHKPKDQK